MYVYIYIWVCSNMGYSPKKLPFHGERDDEPVDLEVETGDSLMARTIFISMLIPWFFKSLNLQNSTTYPRVYIYIYIYICII